MPPRSARSATVLQAGPTTTARSSRARRTRNLCGRSSGSCRMCRGHRSGLVALRPRPAPRGPRELSPQPRQAHLHQPGDRGASGHGDHHRGTQRRASHGPAHRREDRRRAGHRGVQLRPAPPSELVSQPAGRPHRRGHGGRHHVDLPGRPGRGSTTRTDLAAVPRRPSRLRGPRAPRCPSPHRRVRPWSEPERPAGPPVDHAGRPRTTTAPAGRGPPPDTG